jgi:molybdate transport system regulatory protein
MQHPLTVRFRVDIGGRCSIGIGKIELLEGIALAGSLSKAARRMRMSYRRAWLLLADLNKSFDQPVVHSNTGGRGGGGAVLTPFGVRLVAGYRHLEAQLTPLAQSCLREAGRRALVRRSVKGIHPASLKRKTPAA